MCWLPLMGWISSRCSCSSSMCFAEPMLEQADPACGCGSGQHLLHGLKHKCSNPSCLWPCCSARLVCAAAVAGRCGCKSTAFEIQDIAVIRVQLQHPYGRILTARQRQSVRPSPAHLCEASAGAGSSTTTIEAVTLARLPWGQCRRGYTCDVDASLCSQLQGGTDPHLKSRAGCCVANFHAQEDTPSIRARCTAYAAAALC